MKSLNTWLDDYAADHVNLANQKIHRVCVPLIFFSVVALLHFLPLHVGDGLIAVTLIWYALLGARAFLLMTFQITIALGLAVYLNAQFTQPVLIFVVIFILGWIGQFYGHHLEGRRPSFLRDLQYLLIGPIWVWLGRHRGH